jgi:hypothetical protein
MIAGNATPSERERHLAARRLELRRGGRDDREHLSR